MSKDATCARDEGEKEDLNFRASNALVTQTNHVDIFQ